MATTTLNVSAPVMSSLPSAGGVPKQGNVTLDPEVLPKLDPEFVKYFIEVLGKKAPTHTVPIEEVRNNPHKWAADWIPDLDSLRIRTTDWKLPTTDNSFITVRSYQPDPLKFGEGPYPVHINYHGGGFIFGDLTSDAAFCSKVREEIGVIVIDVDYRLCPDVIYGQNIKDAWSALLWARENATSLNINIDSMSIGGISAGAHFSCVLQHLARDANIPLRLAIPAVPPTADHTLYTEPTDSPWPSFAEYSKAPMLNWSRISHFQKYAFPKDKLEELRSSIPDYWITPLLAPNFKGLCDTFMITAECDPLRDEGEGYGMKLVQGNNKVIFKRYPGVPHPFMHMTGHLSQAVQYDQDVIRALKMAHGLT